MDLGESALRVSSLLLGVDIARLDRGVCVLSPFVSLFLLGIRACLARALYLYEHIECKEPGSVFESYRI